MQRYCVAPELEYPHTVYRMTDQIYKVIQWKRVMFHTGPGPAEQHKHYDKKLESSLSRSRRMILEKALCNHWDYFVTLTINGSQFDRTDLPTWRDTFMQWLRDQRKKGFDIKYLIVPEQHKDGSWHAHGLMSGIDRSQLISFAQMDKDGYRTPKGRRLSRKLRDSEYLNWIPYFQKFGFCSLGRIQNSTAASFYITKYITKDNGKSVQELGLKSYYSSQGLNVAEKYVDFYGRDPEIDKLLVNKYEWCSTGMTHLKDHCNFATFLQYEDFSMLQPLELNSYDSQCEAEEYYEFEQMTMGVKI